MSDEELNLEEKISTKDKKDTPDIIKKDKDDNEVAVSAKDEVKKESPDENPQVKNEKETE